MHHHQLATRLECRKEFTGHAFRLFRIPLDEGRAVDDLAARFLERLPLLGGKNACEILRVGKYQVEPVPQDS
ncbi:hypothetical protein D9M68_804440 [compost metagenome]